MTEGWIRTYREVIESAADAILAIDRGLHVVVANSAASRLLGLPVGELEGRPVARLVSAQHRAALAAAIVDTLSEPDSRRQRLVIDLVRSDDSSIHAEVSLGHLRRGDQSIVTLIARNVPQVGSHPPEEKEQLASRYRALFENNLAGVYHAELDGTIFECNESCARILGFHTPEDLLASELTNPWLEHHERDEQFQRLRREKTLTQVETCMRKADGTPVWIMQNLNLVEDDDGRAWIAATMFDITARRLAEEQVAYQANYDSLTGLPNPNLLHERLVKALEQAAKNRRHVAVAFLDLDHFKTINDTLSHRVGDQLLQLVAYRIQNSLRDYDTVARMSGDEFTVILANVKTREDAGHIAGKLLSTIAEPFLLEGRELFVTTSIGVAVSGDDGDDAETLLRNADLAMYRAKELGRNTFEFFGQLSGEKVAERFALENDLRRALQRKELALHFQPQIDSITGQVHCMEALLRWFHPERGLVPPNTFIPIAEEAGLIIPIGEWVLEEACRQAESWRTDRGWNLRVAVNLSPRQFHQKDFPEVIARILETTGLPPEFLELEITESNAMQNPEMAIKTLAELKSMGLRIAIDDFGTGYSSLSYLRRFPIDALKIDQSFVRDIESNENDAAIVSAVIAMAHKLRLIVIAEGVETEPQSVFLREQQCEQMQGFLFSRPLRPGDVVPFIRGAFKPLPTTIIPDVDEAAV
jgi:diguanylate cyclase (GGDEF)-like protein/PAS domain S-box-containing protein